MLVGTNLGTPRYKLHADYSELNHITVSRNGLDIRTVMKLSGHTDLESVMRYLRPAEGREVQSKVNSIKWR
jgi:hypothetical protein